MFSGYDPDSKTYDRQTWNFELDERGFARRDPDLQHPRCVFQLLRQHYSRYTVEQVENICGMPRERVLQNPHIAPAVALWKGITKPLMSVALGVSVLAGFFHYVTKGPKEEPEDDPDAEKAAADRELDRHREERP